MTFDSMKRVLISQRLGMSPPSEGTASDRPAYRGRHIRLGDARPLVIVCLILAACAGWVSACDAAEIRWSVSPYDIRVWIANADSRLSDDWITREIAEQIQRASNSVFGASWNLTHGAAPDSLRTDIARRMDQLDSGRLITSDETIAEADKLFLVAVGSNWFETIVRVREFDCHTRGFSQTAVQSVRQPGMAARAASRLIIDTFAPIAKIQRIRDDTALVSPRSGLLLHEIQTARHGNSPKESSGNSELPEFLMPPDSVLRPIIRRNDRYGNPRKGGIQALPWTILQVTDANRDRRRCRIFSGVSNPIQSRRTPRREQYAMLIRTESTATTVQLISFSREGEPLSGYDLYEKDPETQRWEHVGRSDWNGEIRVGSRQSPLRILYVKNGNQLLARLPLVPGESPSVIARLPDDRQRLAIEGYLTAMQERLIDLVTRRAVLEERIRKRIDQGRMDDAKKLFSELDSLDTKDDFIREIRQRRQSATSSSRRTQAKIDRLFADLRKRLDTFLDPGQLQDLRNELSRIGQGA